jgi:hypothetical protein
MAPTEHAAPPQEAGASVPEAIARYCAASSAGDVEALMATLAADAELVSPLSGRMVFRGREDLRILLGAIYSTLSDLRWGEPIGHAQRIAVIGECRIGGLRLDDAMVFELDASGLITRVRPHLRPWLSTTALALALGPKIAGHPGVVLRALRAHSAPAPV